MDKHISVNINKGKNSLFFRAYHSVNSLLPEKKIFLGDSSQKFCRFCGKDSTETTFKMKAHVIPEFMGNKYCFSNFECDICNSYFGKLEDSLFNFAGINNTFSCVKGKKGYPKFKNDNFEILANDSSSIKLNINTENDNSFNINEKTERLNVNVHQPGYIPQDVYKSLVKIALCMMDESDIKNYEKTLKWLKNPNIKDGNFNFFFNVFKRFGNGNSFPEPMAFLYRKLNNPEFINFPSHTFVIYYGLTQYQIFLPYCRNDTHLVSEKTINFPIEHFLIIEKIEGNTIKYGIDRKYLGDIEKVTGEKTKINIGIKAVK